MTSTYYCMRYRGFRRVWMRLLGYAFALYRTHIIVYIYNVEFFVYAALVYIHRFLIRRIACLTQ
jgi:hypothetical protein